MEGGGGGRSDEPAVKADGWRWIITSFKADVYFSLWFYLFLQDSLLMKVLVIVGWKTSGWQWGCRFVGERGGEEAVSLSAVEIYRQQPPGDWIGN